MSTTARIGLCTLAALALSAACARSPDVSKYTCTSRIHCPDNYVCTGSPAAPGICIRPDAATPVDAEDKGADVSIGDKTDASIDGSGGISGASGGAFDGGGRGTGGIGGAVGTVGTKDAAISSDRGESGTGGMGPLTGRGGATGGNGLGGSPTGGVSGLGGSTPLATGGSTGTGSGGSTPSGTGGSIPPGTGGSTPPGTGGRPGTGGSIPPGTGGSIPPGTGGFSGVTVQLGQARQTMAGFGINDTWHALTAAQAQQLFDPNTGLGLTILRVGMSSNGGFFNSNEAASISAARTYGATTIIGTVWSPPATWKTNNSENDGGHLKPEFYKQWAQRITDFAKNNVLDAMSPQTQPDFASCGAAEPCNGNYPTTVYTAAEMVAFIKVVGPMLKAAGVKLIAPEPSEWLHLWSNESACCSEPGGKPSSDPLKCGCFTGASTPCAAACTGGNGYDYGHALNADTEAWSLLDMIGTHQYDTQAAAPWPAGISDRKPVWVTEMAGIKWWPEQGPSATIENGIAVAGWIHDALTVGEASAWLWWWYNGSDTNEGLYNNGTDTKRHYTLGNYSKFIRPGYVRVDTSGTQPADVLLSAYKGPDGTVVIVAINKGTSSATVPMSISGGTAPASLVPWVTSANDSLSPKTAVSLSGGSFTATLAGKTVTTFVGK